MVFSWGCVLSGCDHEALPQDIRWEIIILHLMHPRFLVQNVKLNLRVFVKTTSSAAHLYGDSSESVSECEPCGHLVSVLPPMERAAGAGGCLSRALHSLSHCDGYIASLRLHST